MRTLLTLLGVALLAWAVAHFAGATCLAVRAAEHDEKLDEEALAQYRRDHCGCTSCDL